MKRYATTKQKLDKSGIRVYSTTYYPEIPIENEDTFIYAIDGDRLDSLAFQFYNDVTLYWIISIRNPNKVNFGSIYLSPGSQLAIPQDISSIVDEYRNLNDL